MIQSDSGIWYPAPLEKSNVIVPLTHRPKPLAVRFRTWICDGSGRILRDGQSGWNTITDAGMDLLATVGQEHCVDYLALSSALGPAKKVLSGGTTLSLTSVADPTNVPVVASANFFASGDLNNTLYIDGLGQELKIIAYTDQQHVTCATRASVWLPGITPTTGPFATAGVHYTATNTLATEFIRFNSYDTAAANYNAELSDYTNQRFIHQRIFLSAAAVSSWTINQLGWSNASSGNVFGKVNLITPDSVAIGQKYRVQLQFFSGYTPINIASFSANWGATIGTYTLAIRQEEVPMDTPTINSDPLPFLKPYLAFGGDYLQSCWWSGSFSLVGPYFQGDPSYTPSPHGSPTGSSSISEVGDNTYISGTFSKNRLWKMYDSYAITSMAEVGLKRFGGWPPTSLMVKPTSPITKPAGYWAALTFPIYWTRLLVN